MKCLGVLWWFYLIRGIRRGRVGRDELLRSGNISVKMIRKSGYRSNGEQPPPDSKRLARRRKMRYLKMAKRPMGESEDFTSPENPTYKVDYRRTTTSLPEINAKFHLGKTQSLYFPATTISFPPTDALIFFNQVQSITDDSIIRPLRGGDILFRRRKFCAQDERGESRGKHAMRHQCIAK